MRPLVAIPLLAVLACTGCGAQAPAAQRRVRQPITLRDDEASKASPLSKDVTLVLPRGWERVSPSVLANRAIDARIDIMTGTSRKTVELELMQFCRMLTVEGFHCENGVIADDGKEGLFPYDTPRRHGCVAVRHYGDGTVVILKGEWSPEHDRRARRDFENIFATVSPK